MVGSCTHVIEPADYINYGHFIHPWSFVRFSRQNLHCNLNLLILTIRGQCPFQRNMAAHSRKTFCLSKTIYTECPRRNVSDFGRVFLMLKYTDITQNTYIQIWTVTEIMAGEKWGLLAVPNTKTCTADTSRDSANDLEGGMQCSLCLRDGLRSQPCYVTTGHSHVECLEP